MTATPEWLVETLAEHYPARGSTFTVQHPTLGEIKPYWKCSCGAGGEIPKTVRFNVECHRAHVAAVVWSEIERRMEDLLANTTARAMYARDILSALADPNGEN